MEFDSSFVINKINTRILMCRHYKTGLETSFAEVCIILISLFIYLLCQGLKLLINPSAATFLGAGQSGQINTI